MLEEDALSLCDWLLDFDDSETLLPEKLDWLPLNELCDCEEVDRLLDADFDDDFDEDDAEDSLTEENDLLDP